MYFRKIIILETNWLKVVAQNEQKSVFICYLDRFGIAQYVTDRATLKNDLVANMLFWSHFIFLQTKNENTSKHSANYPCT
jgi:hypothetical protein